MVLSRKCSFDKKVVITYCASDHHACCFLFFSKNLEAECFLGFVLYSFGFIIAEVMIADENVFILPVVHKRVSREEFPRCSSKQKSPDTGCRNPPAVFSYLIVSCSENSWRVW